MNQTVDRLKRLLIQQQKKISVAESVTAGHLQTLISSVSGSSNYFVGGITAYNIDQKVNLLGVDRDHASSVNCISLRVAEEMVKGVRGMFDTEIGLATTGYAEPRREESIERPFAYFAISIESRIEAGKIDASDRSRVEVQKHVANMALNKLVRMLEA